MITAPLCSFITYPRYFSEVCKSGSCGAGFLARAAFL